MITSWSIVVGLVAAAGCSAEVSAPESASSAAQALPACPTPYPNDNQSRAAATVAFSLMRLAAIEAQSSGSLLAARSILAPQRYTYLPGTSCYSWGCSSPGIQFDSSDPLYSHVTNAMKAELAFAQLDPNLGFYLANGLWRARVFTDGQVYPSIFAIPALAQFVPHKTTTVHLADPTSANDSHYVTLRSQHWCNTTAVTLAETVNESWAYEPIGFPNITDWRSGPPPGYVGVTGATAPNGQVISNAHESFTPFMGTDGQSPYLLVAINGTPQHWAYETFTPVNCWDNPWPTFTCSSSMEVDPVGYATPGADYDATGNLVGPQPNPFMLNPTYLYATGDHAGQYAMNAYGQYGTFSTPMTLFGVTKYKFNLCGNAGSGC